MWPAQGHRPHGSFIAEGGVECWAPDFIVVFLPHAFKGHGDIAWLILAGPFSG